uniref:Haloacid dehalogenase-like hydrolase domain-containing protein 3 n=1 Tax=Oryza punctata TaxID=4537 RepID=A0A0E0LPB2_ORYPU
MAVAARLRSAGARVIGVSAMVGRGGGGEGRWLGTATATVTAVESSGAGVAAGIARWEPMGAREYYDYRRAIYGDITHKAILVDAAGTLLAPTEPMAQVYRTIGEKYGVNYSEDEILMRYRRAYAQPWGRSRLRYVDDGRPFWQHIVSSSTGCSDLQYFEELYQYYTTAKAWQLCDPDAKYVFEALRKAGVKTAVVSNFDTRLRPLLQALNCDHWFDAVAVSAEVAAEKPNPTIFLKACEFLGVKPEEAVHIGDDRRNDLWGARDAGCDAWLWGSDVYSFKENQAHIIKSGLQCRSQKGSELRSIGINNHVGSPAQVTRPALCLPVLGSGLKRALPATLLVHFNSTPIQKFQLSFTTSVLIVYTTSVLEYIETLLYFSTDGVKLLTLLYFSTDGVKL